MTDNNYTSPDGVVPSQDELLHLGSKSGKRRVELLDSTPLAPPVGFERRPPLHIQIREMVLRQVSQAAADAGFETADEADDFDVGDDYDPHSPWEHNFELPESASIEAWADHQLRLEKALEIARAKANPPPSDPPPSQSPPPPTPPSPPQDK